MTIPSPDISVLDFSVLYDLSGAVPSITLTNLSTVTNASALTWWYTIYTPSGTPIHVGSFASPDVTHVAWTTLVIPAGSWTTPLSNGVCAQVEFSPAAPYIVTLSVSDSTNTAYSLAYNAIISRPNGSKDDSCGNFGMSYPFIDIDCVTSKIVATDRTNYGYQNLLAPNVLTTAWTLTYPPDGSGNIPSNATATNVTYVQFNFGNSGDGYNIYLNSIATYILPNNSSVKLQYKSTLNNNKSSFGVWCNIDTCMLAREIKKLYILTKNNCGKLTNVEMDTKLSRATTLFTLILAAILQPLCDEDVQAQIRELEALLGLQAGCGCGMGINPSMTSPPGVLPPPVSCCNLDNTLAAGNQTARTANFINGSNSATAAPNRFFATDGVHGVVMNGSGITASETSDNKVTNLNAAGLAVSNGTNNIDISDTEIAISDTVTGHAVTINETNWIIIDGVGNETTIKAGSAQTVGLVSGVTYGEDGMVSQLSGNIHTLHVELNTAVTANQTVQFADDSGLVILKHAGVITLNVTVGTPFNIPHGLPYTPSGAFIQATTVNAANVLADGYYVTTDGTNIIVTGLGGSAGTTSCSFFWMAIK